MNILMCGAIDLKDEIEPAFEAIVKEMKFDGRFFTDLLPNSDNQGGWISNSIKAVTWAQIIVFVLKEKSGAITWQTEYIEALNQGKPFLLLIHKPLLNNYYESYKDKNTKITKNHKYYQAFLTLDKLMDEERNIQSFTTVHDFELKLSKGIENELEKGLTKLHEYNRRETILRGIRDKDFKTHLAKKISPDQIGFLRNTLLDPFENKEIRKRILYYFTVYKKLSDEDIISLIDDGEQGLQRAVLDMLPVLLNVENDKNEILDFLINSAEESSDVGFVRRAINTIFEIDTVEAVKHLSRLFPADDIGTPKRILKWLVEHESKMIEHLKNAEYLTNLKSLVDLSDSYSSKPESLKEMSEIVKKVIRENEN